MKELFEGLRNLIRLSSPELTSIYRAGQNMQNSKYPRIVISFLSDNPDALNTAGGYDLFYVWIYSKEYDLDTLDDTLIKVKKAIDKKSIITENGDTLQVHFEKGSLVDGFTEEKNEPLYRVGFSIPKIY